MLRISFALTLALALSACGPNGPRNTAEPEPIGNRAPVAQGQSLTVRNDRPVTVMLSATDPDGDAVQLTIAAAPRSGTASLVGNELTYTANPGFTGSDSLRFSATDPQGAASTATVQFRVSAPVIRDNGAADAVNSQVTVAEDTQTAITLQAGGSQPLAFQLLTQPSNGTLSGNPPNLQYLPNGNFSGSDQFRFRASNDEGASDGTVTITVNAVNDRPSGASQTLSLDEDQSVAITLAGTDPDGDTLSYVILRAPANGSLSGSGNALRYTPFAHFNGRDNFVYQVRDGQSSSQPSVVTLDVRSINDVPEAQNLSFSLPEDSSFGFDLVGRDADGERLEYVVLVQPEHGTLTPSRGFAARRAYMPDANFNGTDTLTYVVRDGRTTSNPATVTFTVTAVNDAPIASDVAVVGEAGGTVEFMLAVQDVDGDALSYEVGTPSSGSLSGTPPTLRYTAAADARDDVVFSYRASDGQAQSNTANVRIALSNIQGRALLGPLAGATVTLIPLISRDANGDPADLSLPPDGQVVDGNTYRHITATTRSGSLAEAGFFALPRASIAGAPAAAELFLIRVRGGQDLDANHDGIADASPTPNLGTLQAIIPRSRLLSGELFHVNALTTALADRVNIGFTRHSLTEAQTQMDADARLMLGSTVDSNNGIDALDAYLYDPARHASTLRRPLNSFLAFEQDIRLGSHDRALSHELLSPWLNPVILRGEPGHISGATLALDGNTAYIADFINSNDVSRFVAADLSKPESPQILGTTNITGHSPAESLGSAKVGTTVWIGGFSTTSSGPATGVFSVDVRDPALPQYEPITRIEGLARSLHARGEQLLGIFDGEFRIYDVRDPVAPVILGSYQHAGGQCRQAASLGAHSYLLCGSDLITLETSDPANLQIASVTTLGVTPLFRSSIAIDGATLVIHQGLIPATLRVFDVSNPASPTELSSVAADNLGVAFNLRLYRGMAYLGSSDQRLMAFDLRMPGAYSYLGTWRSIGGSLFNLTIIDERLVGVGSSSYAAIDTSAPLTPPDRLTGLGALNVLFASTIATLPDSSSQQGIAFVRSSSRQLALDITSRSEVDTTDFVIAVDQTSGDGYVASLLLNFDNPIGEIDLQLIPFAANGPRVDSRVFDTATKLRLSDNTATSMDALGDTTVVGSNSGLVVVSTPGNNLAAANELAASDFGRRINRVAQFDALDSTGASNRYVAMLAGNASGLDDLLIRRIAANGQTTPVASIRIGAAAEVCTTALSVKRDAPNALYVGCPRSLVRVDLTKLSNPSVQARLRMVRPAQNIQPLPQPSNLPALYRSADILLVAEFATGLRIVDASGTGLQTLDIIQTLSNSLTTAISRTSPLELLSGESVGVLPLAAPYYPQVR